jgi:hypothetical protein
MYVPRDQLYEKRVSTVSVQEGSIANFTSACMSESYAIIVVAATHGHNS